MNLLEHYVDEIINEEKVQNPKNEEEYYRIIAIVDCYGRKEVKSELFTVDEWKQVKKDGYYMA